MPACRPSHTVAQKLPFWKRAFEPHYIRFKRDVDIVKVTLPYLDIIEQHDDYSKAKMNEVMSRTLAASKTRPCYLELSDETSQRFLFFRGRQIYAAGCAENNRLKETTIRDFLLASSNMSFPRLTSYEVNSKLLHSILILFQKKSALCVMTTLLDLDELLDKIEEEKKSCIVSASRENFVAILRYEKGAVDALGHEKSLATPREGTFREEFLVKIYTISAEQPMEISVYEDLLVTYAPDAKTIDDSFVGNFEELYLSKPPIVSLRFRDKEIDHWVFDKPVLKIGRTPDNDIVIDNLAVSRLHAVLEEEKGNYFVKDCDSLNGTVLNSQKIGRAKLKDGDEICIGKHSILFRKQGGQTVPAGATAQGFDQTVIINAVHGAVPPPVVNPAPKPRDTKSPRLVIKTEYGDRVIELKKEHLTIGKDEASDVVIDKAFIAKKHVEIVRRGDSVVLRRLGGLRKVTVGGRPVREAELKNNDEIRIANEEFIYQE